MVEDMEEPKYTKAPSPQFKIQENEIDSKDPWHDDKLDHKKVADALTSLFKDETNPLVISLHGGWGTGKTFLLKRWAEQLKNDGYQAIYFNVWEDDYCDDPLVAIIGQLWESLKGSDFEEIGRSFKESVKPFITKSVFNVVKSASLGVVDLGEDGLKSVAENAVDEYSKQRKDREDLKKRLTKLVAEVRKK